MPGDKGKSFADMVFAKRNEAESITSKLTQ